MQKNSTPKTDTPKGAGTNESASKAEATNKDATGSNATASKATIELSSVAQKLLDAFTGTPEKLEKLIGAEEQHTKLVLELDSRLLEIKALLKPGDDAIAKGFAVKLTTVERSKLLNEKAKLLSTRRKLTKSNRVVSIKLIKNSKDERREIRFDDLRDRVKDPSYYKKYGKHIPPAFEKWINGPMSKKLLDKISTVKSVEPAGFSDALAKVLLAENPALYIKSTGNKAMKSEYFSEFQKALDQWKPETIKIKK